MGGDVDSPFRFSEAAFRAYRRRFRQIDGWIDPLTAEFIYRLSCSQREISGPGSVLEIGVHHGKSFIPLYLGSRSDEPAVAIDVFENQWLNPDGSGRGDRVQFLKTVADVCGGTAGIEVITKSSLDLTAQDIVNRAGKPRFMSIDGSHTTEATLNDLKLAASCIAERGAVLLDDVFNPNWPGVMSGLFQGLSKGLGLEPVAIVPGKMLMCRRDGVTAYQAWIRANYAIWLEFEKEVFGCTVLGICVNSATRVRRWKNSPWGQRLNGIVRGKALRP